MSTYGQVREIPERFEKIIRKQSLRKVSKLKKNFKSFLAPIREKDAIIELTTLIEENP